MARCRPKLVLALGMVRPALACDRCRPGSWSGLTDPTMLPCRNLSVSQSVLGRSTVLCSRIYLPARRLARLSGGWQASSDPRSLAIPFYPSRTGTARTQTQTLCTLLYALYCRLYRLRVVYARTAPKARVPFAQLPFRVALDEILVCIASRADPASSWLHPPPWSHTVSQPPGRRLRRCCAAASAIRASFC